MIRSIGQLVEKEIEAEKLLKEINLKKIEASPRKRVAYLIWKNPEMTVGSDTYIHSVLEYCGFENIFSDRLRYPEVSFEELQIADFIFLSTEPYSFTEKDVKEFKEKCKTANVFIVDGTIFSWYGSRMKKIQPYISQLRNQLF